MNEIPPFSTVVTHAVAFSAIALLALNLRADPAPKPAVEDPAPVTKLAPVGVNESPLGSIAVVFSYLTEDDGDGKAPIFNVTVTDVPPGSPGERANLRKWDRILALNRIPIRGLTLLEFAKLIRRERQKGDLHWTIGRGVANMTFETSFNGRSNEKAHAWEYAAAPVEPPPKAVAPEPADKIDRMAPYTVNETWSSAIDVTFVMAKEKLFEELDDPIVEATVVSVVGDAPIHHNLLEVGDVLIGLNGTSLSRLTLRQLATLVAEQKAKGAALMWDVRRGIIFTKCRHDGKWIHPLPALKVATASGSAKSPASTQ